MSDKSAGFTLLEVLVAVAIAGVALVALFQAAGGGLTAIHAAAHYEAAVQRAQSHLAAVGRDVALLEGESEGDDGGGYRWRLRIVPRASWPGGAGGSLSLFDVEVAVTAPGIWNRREVVLKTSRITASAPVR